MNKTEKAYQDWTNQRNKVLEHILTYFRLAISDRFRFAFSQIAQEFILSPQSPQLDQQVVSCAVDVGNLIKQMRYAVYNLTYASSLEIGAIMTGEKVTSKSPDINLDQAMISGGQPEFRVVFYLNQIIRKIQNEVERLALQDLKLTKEDIERLLPRPIKVNKARKPLRQLVDKKGELGLKEAKEKPLDMSVTFLTDSQWDEILKGYMNEYVSPYRGPDFIVGEDLDGEYVYAWEMERDLTDDFVKSVQEGQLEAYNKAGVKKFVWIAVLDNRTCEKCCVWRDGLTTDEIKALLKGKRRSDECQAVVPPAHFNCRCTLAPAFDSLPEMPEVKWKKFDEWLES